MSLQDEILRINDEINRNRELLLDPDLSLLVKDEIAKLEDQKKLLESSLSSQTAVNKNTETSSQASITDRAATMEFRPGAGGDEAKIWVGDLMRMYLRYCETIKLKADLIDEGVIKISGVYKGRSSPGEDRPFQAGPYGIFRYESGVHRVQRIPKTEAHDRIHTSTASVAVLPEITSSEVSINDNELSWAFSRSGGPGGQNVNKVSTAVRLTHIPSGLVTSVRQERTQQQNKSIALELLRSKLWEMEQEKTLKTLGQQRIAAIGRGMRAEKIRTYNFPQNRVTDHRINKSWHNLDSILEGNIGDIIQTCQREIPGITVQSAEESPLNS
ncbi:PCRF domain-containing protein [Candidatus Collierbacteria bacterium]|nr:PCRF domain-containing protein [Candidatus Collierbacteria bacterium]